MTVGPKAVLFARIFLGCIGVGASLLLVLLIGVATWFFFDDAKARVNAVRKNFAEMSGVKLTCISDLQKQASQCITANIEVLGKGPMSFTGLEPGSFRPSSRVYLNGIGPFRFRTRFQMGKDDCYGYVIDIGPNSPIPAARSLDITSVPAAVSHYSELLALVERWPVTENAWPSGWPVKKGEWSHASNEEARFVDPSGTWVFYCLNRLPGGVAWPPGY